MAEPNIVRDIFAELVLRRESLWREDGCLSHRCRKSKAVDRERAHWPEQVIGGKYVRQLQGYVDELREADPHGNRQLFLDDVFVTYLLAFFNPALRTLRTIEDFSQSHQAASSVDDADLPQHAVGL